MTQLSQMNLPGEPKIPEAIAQELQKALAQKGLSYQPRTHHRDGNKPHYTNRLILETSPYLLQHAHNPVNWFPWGPEAFETAAREGKPVFLSIGYSTCHWCHVMEEESFEDKEIAAFLNQHYVCIKVDREERPDVDAVYMSAVQNLTGSGGWPMSVWLTSEREPFFAGTYFPPREGVRGARQGFLSLLQNLERTFRQSPDEVKKAAGSLAAAVKADMEGQAPTASAGVPGYQAIESTVDHYKRAFDAVHGGVRRAPKFPSHVPIRLLLRHHRRVQDPVALQVALVTLEKMAAGGMYDQVGGGFHRYSTDARWLVPHFEKMLYDNALLVLAYTEAFQATGRPDFARVAREVLDYVLREMTSPEGGFYSATDADSEGEEGKFFVWSLDEIKRVLGDEADAFVEHYGVKEAGNFEGYNIPFVARPSEDRWQALAPARKKLYEARAKRVAPARDDKILAAWNGLMLSAFAVAGRVLDEPRYTKAAARAAEFLLTNLRKDGRMLRSYKDGRTQPQGFLEDHAFVTAGLLDLFEATAQPRWLQEALALAKVTEQRFADQQGGWFMVPHDGEALLAKERPTYDGAEPSGTSVTLMNAVRLAAFTEDHSWRQVAEHGLARVRQTLEKQGVSMTEALLALDFFLDTPREVVVVWPKGQLQTASPLLEVWRKTFVPSRALVAAEEGPALEQLAKLVPFAAGKAALQGQPTAYVCEQGRCELPTHDPEAFRSQLLKAKAP